MTDSGAEPSPLVLDATCLSHFARADRLDVLQDLLVGRRCWTTEIVLAELNQGVADYRCWATSPARSSCSSTPWTQSRGSACTTPGAGAWARQTATRERPASSPRPSSRERRRSPTIAEQPQVGRFHGLDVHGTIWLLAGACRQGKLTQGGTATLIDALRAIGHRLPCTGAGFASYARQHGLL